MAAWRDGLTADERSATAENRSVGIFFMVVVCCRVRMLDPQLQSNRLIGVFSGYWAEGSCRVFRAQISVASEHRNLEG
jgi:hypothetical protein